MVVIPEDIVASIIDAVENDQRLLRTCALVSSSFLLPTRKRLFSDIRLDGDRACQRLYQILVDNPVIQSFIRSIGISVRPRWHESRMESNDESLILVLRFQFPSLRSLFIYGYYRLDWKDISSELKDVISTIIHSATLKTLKLDFASNLNVPIEFFQGIHLHYLQLDSLLPNHFGHNTKQSDLLTQNASESGEGDTAIDECVWNYSSDMQLRDFNESIFLPFMSRLRVLKIDASSDEFCETTHEFDFLSSIIRSLRISLTTPATLEHLEFDITLRASDNYFDYYAIFDGFRRDVWPHVDSIITHPTGSRLRRVKIYISYSFRYDDDVVEPAEPEIEELVLEALPLLREKGILLVKATMDQHG